MNLPASRSYIYKKRQNVNLDKYINILDVQKMNKDFDAIGGNLDQFDYKSQIQNLLYVIKQKDARIAQLEGKLSEEPNHMVMIESIHQKFDQVKSLAERNYVINKNLMNEYD